MDNFKYLGVILDNKLLWTKHIDKAKEKATMVMATCRRMVGNTWGLNPRVCKWLYTSVVRPVISYGALTWAQCLGKKGTIAKLDKLQRGGCIAALNATRSTPTQGMEIILGLTPLHIHIKSTIIMSYTRLASSNNWKPRRVEQLNPKSHCKTIER